MASIISKGVYLMTGEGDNKPEGQSTLVSRNITVIGRRTSVRLEPEMWTALREIARRENCKIHDICSLIQMRKNPDTSLTAAIRVFLMLYYRAAATEDGHGRAGHGNFQNMVRRARMSEDYARIQAAQVVRRHGRLQTAGAVNNDSLMGRDDGPILAAHAGF
jgi:predicted DNA-binding ribbon-helix-helix protein